jgi:addiction module RelE/StbE family toxin
VKAFRLDIPAHVADRIRHLHPDLKKNLKAALRAIAEDPGRGQPLLGELKDYWKYRVKRFRIVYSVDRPRRLIRIFAIGHRQKIYEKVAELIKLRRKSGSR